MKKGIRRIKAVNTLRAPSHAIIGYNLLRNALAHFKLAGSCYTAACVRAAISSAKGAVRAAQYRQKRGAQ